MHIEARPQAFLFKLWKWDVVIEQEKLADHFWAFVHSIDPDVETFKLHRYNDINGQWVNRVRAKTNRHLPWQEYYCPETEKNVRELYALDFDCLSSRYLKEFPGNYAAS